MCGREKHLRGPWTTSGQIPEDEDREDISPAVDPKAAISGPEEEEDQDISPAVDPEAAISGPGEDNQATSL